MEGCSTTSLNRLLDKEVSLDERIQIYDHLDLCKTCRELIYVIARDRDRHLTCDVRYAGAEDVA